LRVRAARPIEVLAQFAHAERLYRQSHREVPIVADVKVVPTIAGILASRDEVLEAGIRQIVGDAVSAAEIQRLAMPMVGSGVQPASP
jgi:hypothetical protein